VHFNVEKVAYLYCFLREFGSDVIQFLFSASYRSIIHKIQSNRKTGFVMTDQHGVSVQHPGIGKKLRAFRKERGLSIRVLAERARLSPNTISLIENNSASPTVTTLYTIANVLDVPLSAFFVEDENGEEVRLVRAQDQEGTVVLGVKVSVLPGDVLNRRVHILQFMVESGKGSGNEQMAHRGDELVICIQGELEYRVKDTIYSLKEQDSLAFNASFPHSFYNRGRTETHFLVLITTETDQSYRFHMQPITPEQ
jgi:transcriptional regulator with XRE-family HTH domain